MIKQKMTKSAGCFSLHRSPHTPSMQRRWLMWRIIGDWWQSLATKSTNLKTFHITFSFNIKQHSICSIVAGTSYISYILSLVTKMIFHSCWEDGGWWWGLRVDHCVHLRCSFRGSDRESIKFASGGGAFVGCALCGSAAAWRRQLWEASELDSGTKMLVNGGAASKQQPPFSCLLDLPP